MDYDIFSQQVAKIKNLPLPGVASHYKMAPEVRVKELKAGMKVDRNPKKAGVMALFYPDDDYRTHFLLIHRKSYPGVHSDQISFPGGKVEKGDPDLMATALRETHEEVGVPPQDVLVIREMTEVYIPPSNFIVQPYLGLYKKEFPFVPQEAEVAAVVEVSLDDFMSDSNITTQLLSTSYARNIEVPAFSLNGHVVWGATAMMMSEIREMFKRVF